jgi:hypothetical protein
VEENIMKSMSKFSQLSRVFVVVVLILAGIAASGLSVSAEVFSPVIVRPYDPNSLERLVKSYASLETNLGKLESAGNGLQSVAKAVSENRTDENEAALMEKIGQASKISIEVLTDSIKLMEKIQPEISAYKAYMKKLNRDMHAFSGNPLYDNFSSERKKEIDSLNEFIKELEMVKTDLKEARQVMAAQTNVWAASKNIEEALKQLIPNGNMGKFFSGLTQLFKPLMMIKDIVAGDIRRSGLPSQADYEGDMEEYKGAKNAFFKRL